MKEASTMWGTREARNSTAASARMLNAVRAAVFRKGYYVGLSVYSCAEVYFCLSIARKYACHHSNHFADNMVGTKSRSEKHRQADVDIEENSRSTGMAAVRGIASSYVCS